ncbi:MAG: hypothetical protein GX327_06845 [Epulopiscium sp.]|jgi:uncharacterized protein YndB with AHSA1/START domain|nr:hypothetical protein [Candidatus Epulonipiscium sp.]
MSTKRKIWIMSSLVFIISSIIVYNVYINRYPKANENNIPPNPSPEVVWDKEMQKLHVVQGNTDKITPSTLLIYQYYDEKSNKTIEEKEKVPYFLIDLTKDEVQEIYYDWQVSSFSSEKVVLKKSIFTKNNSQYVLGVHDGFVAIFYNNEEDVTKVKEVTETPISSLPPEERNKLEKGIKVYSEDELIRMLEDYTS